MSAPHSLCNRPLGTHVFRPDVRYGNIEAETCTKTKVPHITVTYAAQTFTATDAFTDFSVNATKQVTSGQIRLNTANAVYISVPGLYMAAYDTTIAVTANVATALLINSLTTNLVHGYQTLNSNAAIAYNSLSSGAIMNVNAGQTITMALVGTAVSMAATNFARSKLEVVKLN